MAARLDLQARLRALREPRVAAPAAPVASVSPSPPSRRPLQAPTPPPPPPPTPPPVVINMSLVLGPAYDDAVRTAQFAIDCERRGLVHTAIDGYINAGQALVALGRLQTAPHLVTIVKTKALALLQRAEGLEDWAAQVLASNVAPPSAAAPRGARDDALQRAMARSQEQQDAQLSETEALVGRMRSENDEMQQKLNKLVLLTHIRTRLRKVVSDRRARKAAATAAAAVDSTDVATDGVDGSGDVDAAAPTSADERPSADDGDARATDDDDQAPRSLSLHPPPPSTASAESPREEQKRALVNELHTLIGLPEISHLRTFRPLGADAQRDRRRDELEQELETARREAERLRAAVADMEASLRAAAEYSKERSLKLEEDKAQDLARLRAELARTKDELAMERQQQSSRYVTVFSDDEDDDDEEELEGEALNAPTEFEDEAMLARLRLSLHGDEPSGTQRRRRRRRGDTLEESAASSSSSSLLSPRVQQQRTSRAHSSPRRRPPPLLPVDNDDGVWL